MPAYVAVLDWTDQGVRNFKDSVDRYDAAQSAFESLGVRFPKVNRCLTEGRRALAQRLAEIESGSGCAKPAPVLEALLDGDPSAEQLGLLRPHLSTCLDCRARLKSMRAARHAAASAARRD